MKAKHTEKLRQIKTKTNKQKIQQQRINKDSGVEIGRN